MNWLQIKSGIKQILTGASAVAGTVALFNPQWGSAIQGGVIAASAIVGGVSVLASTFSKHNNAAAGLTGAEAAAALNQASLQKSLTGVAVVTQQSQQGG